MEQGEGGEQREVHQGLPADQGSIRILGKAESLILRENRGIAEIILTNKKLLTRNLVKAEGSGVREDGCTE